MSSLAPLLQLLEGPSLPRLPAVTWRSRTGEGVVARLVRGGVLVAEGLAPEVPCGAGQRCSARVVPNVGNLNRPLVAVCDQEDGAGCEPHELTADEATLLAVSQDGLVRQLRRAVRLTATASSDDAGFPDVLTLGRLAAIPAYLARQPGLPGFEAWLGSLGEGLVLVPTTRALAPALLRRFGPGCPVEVRALDTSLRLDGHQFVEAAAAAPLMVKDSARPSYVVSGAICEVIDRDGRRPLTAQGYAELLEQASTFDLFLDTTVTIEGGAHRGLRRTENGKLEEVALTKHEAAAIVELVTTGRALRAGDFKTLSVSSVDKVVERARKKLDLQFSRFEWRAIHTLRGATPEAKRWQFRPDALGRWGVVVTPV